MPKKILPRKFWNSEEEVKNISREEFLEKLKNFGEKENIPNISWTGTHALRFFLEMKKPKKVMEIGCANGFSTIVIADYLEKWGGRLITCDVSTPSIASAKENLRVAKIENVEIREGSALEVFEDESDFDFIFIDGQKSWTKKFFCMAEEKISPAGIIVVDDTEKFPEKMKSFQNYIACDAKKEQWNYFRIPEKDDALMVFWRR